MKFDTIVRRIRAFPLPQRTKKGYERGVEVAREGRGESGRVDPSIFLSL